MARETCHDCDDPPAPGRARCEACGEAHRLTAHSHGESDEVRALRRILRRVRRIRADLDAIAGTPEHEVAIAELRRLAPDVVVRRPRH